MKALTWCCRWLVGALLLAAGFGKAFAPLAFLHDIEGYRLIDGPAAVAVALFLPWFEIAAGAGLCLRRPYRGAALAAGVMFVVFAVALAQAWVRGLDVECGCFGGVGGARANYPWWVARDMLLLAASLVCWKDAVIRFRVCGTTDPRLPDTTAN